MRRQFVPAVLSMIVFTLVLGVGYGLVVTGVAQLASRTRPTAPSSNAVARTSARA